MLVMDQKKNKWHVKQTKFNDIDCKVISNHFATLHKMNLLSHSNTFQDRIDIPIKTITIAKK